MIVLRFRFVTGRWHATAWGSHVNEGIPDWPPAPWRICRALIATWFHKHQAVFKEARIRELIHVLSGTAPSFSLPSATMSHSRHYVPVNEGRKENRTKIFDTFVHVAPGQWLDVMWPIDLSPDQRELLATLAASMNYLGRGESLVEVVLLPETVAHSPINARPVSDDEHIEWQEEPIRLLAPETPQEFETWVAKARASNPKSKRKRNAALPSSIFDALLADTAELKAAGWTQPPGSRWINYIRPVESLRVASQRVAVPHDHRPTVARFAVVSTVPPRITEALSLGERIHRALVARYPAPVFTGCDADGQPLAAGHQHAFYLSECDLRRGSVNFLTLYARMGFDLGARQALEHLRQTWGYAGHQLQLILLGLGEPEDFARGKAVAGHSLPLGKSRAWVSVTPFVPTRHPKTRRNGEPKLDGDGTPIASPEHDLMRLLRESGLPWPINVERLPYLQFASQRIHWLEFQRTRRIGEGRKAGARGYGFRIVFPDAVQGPISLGYGAHFGLGLFIPEQ